MMTREEYESIRVCQLRAVIDTDLRAVDDIFKNYLQPIIFRYFFSRCKDRELSMDLTQESVAEFIKCLSSSRDDFKIVQLAMIIAARNFKDYLRKRRVSEVDLEQAPDLPIELSTTAIRSVQEDLILKSALDTAIHDCGSSLPKPYDQVFFAYIAGATSQRSVAKYLTISREKAAIQFPTMLRRLKNCLLAKDWSLDHVRSYGI